MISLCVLTGCPKEGGDGVPQDPLRAASEGPIAVRKDADGRVRTTEGSFTTTGATAEARARACRWSKYTPSISRSSLPEMITRYSYRCDQSQGRGSR